MSHPFLLIILDGWGYREDPTANAIAQAYTPCWDALWQQYPHCLISGSGTCVGLPDGQMGNSEVGHLHMGAGRTVWQDLTRIDLAIKDGSFFKNPVLQDGVKQAAETGRAVHLMGLLSLGGVHSHESHFHAMMNLAAQIAPQTPLYIHAFLDGRDTPPRSAAASLSALEAHCQKNRCGRIASLTGRYYAMDRDNRWDRIEKAWRVLVTGEGDYTANTAQEALALAYARGETDEFVSPTHINGLPGIRAGDTVIFMNFRADRARELTKALTQPDFTAFARPAMPTIHFVTFTEYDPAYPLPTAFTGGSLHNMLGQYLSDLHHTQLRVAETEKYAHVTFFFNGGRETPFPGEERILIPSPKVATYDLAPEMSAEKITDAVVEALHAGKHDFIVCNYANPDMVGHTGNLPATRKAIETIDHCLQRIKKALDQSGGETLITADHGNAELMSDPGTGQPHTAHTRQPVPLLYIGRPAQPVTPPGPSPTLADIAPTILHLLGLPQPAEMTGRSLFRLNS